MEHELWLTALFNQYLAAPANYLLNLVGLKHDPAHPWSNFMAMELFVVLAIIVIFAMLKPRLSMDRPGKFQHIFEMVYNFLNGQTDEIAGRAAHPYLPFIGTIFIFVLFCNLLGAIPSFESPTMFAPVPLGCALATFFFYNFVGVKEQGAGHYLKHFAGPIPAMAPLMFPIEVISNLARPLSLTIRLYANIYAGEQVTLAFMSLIPLLVPLPFMGLHIFVAFLQAYVFALLTMVYLGDVLPHHEQADEKAMPVPA
ncbi:MAG TPA: F0F1 ATP synthase subunit A [Bryobacteraceae bacterium]|nr:F0F1 ATP synthase subunit A [Bryobacteraceae bacterium]